MRKDHRHMGRMERPCQPRPANHGSTRHLSVPGLGPGYQGHRKWPLAPALRTSGDHGHVTIASQ